MNKTIEIYNQKSLNFFNQYESVPAEKIHNSWINYIDKTDSVILDVGSGSGRDAQWLAKKGFKVVAVEPAENLRNLAIKHNNHKNITWLNDTLPKLKTTHQLDIKFDFILLSAVWMHISQDSRESAFKYMTNLLNRGGKLVISLRHGHSPDEREMHEVSLSEIKILAKKYSLKLITCQDDRDLLTRNGVKWEVVLLECS